MPYVWTKIVVSLTAVADTLFFWMSGDEEKQNEDSDKVNQGFASNSLNDEETLNQLEDEGLYLCADGCVKEFIARENGSTGYQWIVNTEDCSPEVLQVETSYDPTCQDYDDDVVARRLTGGCSGTRTFVFTGVGKGQCTYKMANAQPWEFDWEDEDSVQDAKDGEKYVEFEIFVV